MSSGAETAACGDDLSRRTLTRLCAALPRSVLVSLLPAEAANLGQGDRAAIAARLAVDHTAPSILRTFGRAWVAGVSRRLGLPDYRRGPLEQLVARVLRALEEWLPFAEARVLARVSGVKGTRAWRRGPRPHGVPPRPDIAYALEGWSGWVDFLGAYRSPASTRWRPFHEARAFARALDLLDKGEWRAFARGELSARCGLRPDDIPFDPRAVYPEFMGWSDWLDAERVQAPLDPRFRPFKKARAFVCGLQLGTREEYLAWRRGELVHAVPPPSDLPLDPDLQYPRAWRGWADWLGTLVQSRRRRLWRPFPEARDFVRSQGLPDADAWHRYCVGDLPGFAPKPADIPSTPDMVYAADGWKGMGDWLGTDTKATHLISQRPYADALPFVHGLRLSSMREWRAYCAGARPDLPPRPPDIPVHPANLYRGRGWIGPADWLGTSA